MSNCNESTSTHNINTPSPLIHITLLKCIITFVCFGDLRHFRGAYQQIPEGLKNISESASCEEGQEVRVTIKV